MANDPPEEASPEDIIRLLGGRFLSKEPIDPGLPPTASAPTSNPKPSVAKPEQPTRSGTTKRALNLYLTEQSRTLLADLAHGVRKSQSEYLQDLIERDAAAAQLLHRTILGLGWEKSNRATISVTLTRIATQMLDTLAREMGLSRTNIIELLLRNVIRVGATQRFNGSRFPAGAARMAQTLRREISGSQEGNPALQDFVNAFKDLSDDHQEELLRLLLQAAIKKHTHNR